MELKLALKLLEFSEELAPEDTAENTDRQQEAWRRGDPPCSVEREAASRNHAVDMGMMLEVLPPRVQDAEEANVGSEVLRIAGDLDRSSGAAAEEQIVEQSLVLKYE